MPKWIPRICIQMCTHTCICMCVHTCVCACPCIHTHVLSAQCSFSPPSVWSLVPGLFVPHGCSFCLAAFCHTPPAPPLPTAMVLSATAPTGIPATSAQAHGSLHIWLCPFTDDSSKKLYPFLFEMLSFSKGCTDSRKHELRNHYSRT